MQVRGLRFGHAGQVRSNGAGQARLEIDARDVAVLRIHVEDRRVARRRHRVLAVATGDREPLGAVQAAGPTPTTATTPATPCAARRPHHALVSWQPPHSMYGLVLS